MLADLSHIGKALREARRAAKLSQVQLSEKLGITQGTVSRAEAGSDVRANTLVEIARALDLDVVLVPRRLRSNIAMLVEAKNSGRHTAIYTGAGDEPYYEDVGDEWRPGADFERKPSA